MLSARLTSLFLCRRHMLPAALFSSLLVLGSAFPCSAAPRAGKKPAEQASGPVCKANILMEASTGEVISEFNAHNMLPPASMIKSMTMYVILKKVEEGIVKMDDVITASAHAAKIGGSQVYLKQGEQFTLEQLLEAVAIHSSNDAAVAIAEHIAGSSEGFVDLMNMEAQSLGLKETEIHSPHGLPPSRDEKPDLVSAYDLAQLARIFIQKYPKILDYTRKPTVGFRDNTFEMLNTNKLVTRYAGCDGLKTGYYSGAGFGVVATAVRNNMRMISVVMGCQNGKKRFDEAARLLSLGFSQYKLTRLMEKGAPAASPVAVVNGEKPQISVVAAKEFTAAVKPADQTKVVRRENLCPGLQAPVAQGTPCGTVSFFLNDRELGKAEMVAGENVPALTNTGKLLRLLKLK